MSADNVSFVLTSEELFYGLRMAELPNIPGLGVKPFGDIEEDVLEKIMEFSFRVLIARQLLIPAKDKGFRLDKVLSATLAVCAEPEKMVVLMFAREQEPGKTIYFYSSASLDVRHDILFSGMHQFQTDADVDLGKDAVLGVLNDQEGNLNEEFTGASYCVNNEKFENARDIASDSVEEATNVLAELGLSQNNAADLAGIFAQPDFRFTMQYLYRSDDNPNHKVVSVISKGDAWWIVTAETPSNETLVVEKTKKSSVIEIVSEAYRALGVEV